MHAQDPKGPPAQEPLLPEDDSTWRKEVSDRLNRYQARRRPRPPRYPSLSLKFEAPETRWVPPVRESVTPPAAAQASTPPVVQQAVAMQYVDVPEETPSADPLLAEVPPKAKERRRNESAGKLIEFPRTMYAHAGSFSDLAEPIIDRPRILEAPELLPPPPALGGMTIEEVARPEPERRLGIDMPLQSAPVGSRALAAAIDGMVVLSGSVLFGGVFYRVVGLAPPLQQIAMVGGGLLAVCWATYQYLLMVYSGSTLGLRALKLHVERFDGQPANRKVRRTRALCALLSAAALGLGYAWHFLDEDGLCWHERVTKTHIACEKQ